MTILPNTLDEAVYNSLIREFIAQAEGTDRRMYTDDKGIVSIGYGFNLRRRENVSAIISAIYPAEWGGLSEIEQGDLITKFVDAVSRIKTPNLSADADQLTSLESDVVDILNTPPYNFGATQFRFQDGTNSEIDLAADSIISSRSRELKHWLENSVGGEAAVLADPISTEKAALFSLYYTGILNNEVDENGNEIRDADGNFIWKSPGLMEALRTGDRLEAWYQIRYTSNGGGSRDGTAKRRFLESQIFGMTQTAGQPTPSEIAAFVTFLFPDGRPSDALKKIVGYESEFGHNAFAAQRDFTAAGVGQDYHALTFGQVLRPFADALMDEVSGGEFSLTGLGATIDGEVVLGAETAMNGETASIQPMHRRGLGVAAADAQNLPVGVSGLNDLLLAVNLVGGQRMQGLWGDDVLVGSSGSDALFGDYMDNRTSTAGGNDDLLGLGGDDSLYGQGGSDNLLGGDGHDMVDGGSENDDLTGGRGIDILRGGEGMDTYHYSTGDGIDYIVDADGSLKWNGQTIQSIHSLSDSPVGIERTSGMYVADTGQRVVRSGDDFYVYQPGSFSDVAIIQATAGAAPLGWAQTAAAPDYSQMLQVAGWSEGFWNPTNGGFMDGGMPQDYFHRKYNEDYSWANDSAMFVRMAQEHFVMAKSVADHGYRLPEYFFGALDGSDRGDVFWGSYGFAGMTNHSFHMNGEYVTIDTPYMPPELLRGMDGNDLIYGDYEKLVVAEWTGSGYVMHDPYTTPEEYRAAGGTGTPWFGGDILIGGRGSDVIYGQQDDDLIFGMDEYRAPFVLLKNYNYYPNTDPEWGDLPGHYTLESLENVGDSDYLNGGSGNDEIYAGSYNDTIIGEAGDDRIRAGAGSDFILGGDGDDSIFADSYLRFATFGDLTYPGSDGSNPTGEALINYQVSSYYSADFIAESAPGKEYDDFIDGGSGVDFILGELGNDTILGGTGNDTLVGDRLNLDDPGTFYTDPLLMRYHAVRGGGWTAPVKQESLDSELWYQHLPYALHGNDTIYGGDGDDHIYGNGGDDVLIGGLGNDRYYYESGDGKDIIHLQDHSAASTGVTLGADVLVLGVGIPVNGVAAERNGADLTLRFSSTDVVELKDFFSVKTASIQFSDNAIWDYETVRSMVAPVIAPPPVEPPAEPPTEPSTGSDGVVVGGTDPGDGDAPTNDTPPELRLQDFLRRIARDNGVRVGAITSYVNRYRKYFGGESASAVIPRAERVEALITRASDGIQDIRTNSGGEYSSISNQVQLLVSAMAAYSPPTGAGKIAARDAGDAMEALLTSPQQLV